MTRRNVTSLVAVISACLLSFVPTNAPSFCFEEAGAHYDISPGLLQSIARVESGLNPKALGRNKNGSTDFGLMQINSTWIEPLKLNPEKLMTDPCYNVRTGARILRDCVDTWGYSWRAVGCYHAVGKDRQTAYSWKIYHELIKDRQRAAAITKKNEASPEVIRTGSSLQFRVRDRDETDAGGER